MTRPRVGKNQGQLDTLMGPHSASATLAVLGHMLNPVFGGWQTVAGLGHAVGGFLLAAVIFVLIFKVAPRVHVLWKDVWISAFFTAVLFTIGKSLIGLYIVRQGVAPGFGAAGSLMVVLPWVYWSAQILLIGAELTWVDANRFGSRQASGVKALVAARV